MHDTSSNHHSLRSKMGGSLLNSTFKFKRDLRTDENRVYVCWTWYSKHRGFKHEHSRVSVPREWSWPVAWVGMDKKQSLIMSSVCHRRWYAIRFDASCEFFIPTTHGQVNIEHQKYNSWGRNRRWSSQRGKPLYMLQCAEYRQSWLRVASIRLQNSRAIDTNYDTRDKKCYIKLAHVTS